MARVGVKERFSRSAATYDRHADVQDQMGQALLSAVRSTALTVERVLEIGCGTGTFTRRLALAYPQASILAIDVAPSMIEYAAKQNLPNNVTLQIADAEAFKAEAASIDLIVANAAFQWFARPSQTVRQLSDMIRCGGHLAFATFGPGTFHELRNAFYEAERTGAANPATACSSAPRALPMLACDAWERIARQAQLTPVHVRNWTTVKHFPTVRHFLADLKALGATYPGSRRPLTRSLLTRMESIYEQMFGGETGIPVTYEVVLLIARKS